MHTKDDYAAEFKLFLREYNYNVKDIDPDSNNLDLFEHTITERNIFEDDFIEENNVDVTINEDIFFKEGCGCERQCIRLFPRDEILASRLDSQNLNGYCDQHINHQNILLMGALNCLANTTPETAKKGHKSKTRDRANVDYKFRGVSVCRSFFLFVNGVGMKKFRNILGQIKKNGIEVTAHKSSKTNIKTLTLQQRVHAVTFIKNFSLQNSLVLPGRMPCYRDVDLHILPSSMSKTYVYEKYLEACTKNETNAVGRTSWYQIWKAFCPNIVIQHPRTDLCHVCHKNVTTLNKMASMNEESKAKILQESLNHLSNVQTERHYYSNLIAEIAPIVANMALGPHVACDFDGLMHYSFDFAQQVHLPHDAQQVGPLYFLTGYKIGLFGIAIEPMHKFVLYVVPESCATGKGANVVISFLHHFFENFALGETKVVCHADNCAGQNKNNYLIQYGLWRVMTGRHKSFQLSFLPVGHTKFAPDQYFGLFKKKFRKSQVSTVKDVCEAAVTACRKTNSIMSVMVGNEVGNTVNVKTYDWVNFFKTKKPATVPNLLSYSHFKTELSLAGQIACEKSATGESCVHHVIFKDTFSIDEMPEVIQPQGLSYDRQKYLYEKIRQFVPPESQDILCPKPYLRTSQDPLENLPQVLLTQSQPSCSGVQSLPNTKRKKPTCTYCGEVGHRNQVRGGVYFCKKRRSEQENL